MVDVEDILEHHGIKGMHWGIRNKVNPKTGRVSSDHKTVAELRKRPTPSLTNKQIQTVNTRLGLEQNFHRLNPSKVQRGERHIKALIGTAGTITSLIALGNKTPEILSFINKHKGKVVKIKPGHSFI